ncbi:MAG: cob(I)yrinic acid a,c-diamide adenosyltransferase [Verrucomicrobiae bacterium]|nr:cob(I)yrinic acid a,c-diamide adenosyltransferase [Verrucomicrobiae bacterium]
MSSTSKPGDRGVTRLMYGRQVSKAHPRLDACGTVDELNAALGLARSLTRHEFVRETVLAIQADLVVLMGELATALEDLPRYVQDGFSTVSHEMTARLEAVIEKIKLAGRPPGWATPGASPDSAALDLARTICRRAERRACELAETGQLKNPEIVAYLNRLSELLWKLARWVEMEKPGGAGPDL